MRAVPAISYEQVVVVLALIGTMAGDFVQQGLPVLFPFIQDEFGTTRAQLGFVAIGLTLGGTFTVLFMGWLADTIGVRRLLSVALLLIAAGVLLFSQIQSIMQGILLSILMGLAASARGPTSVKAIMDWVMPRIRGVSIGIKETSVPFSGIIAAAILPLLAVTFSWRRAMMFMALPIAVISIGFFAAYRDKPSSRTDGNRSNLIKSLVQVARNRDTWLADISYGLMVALHIVFVSYLILFLRDDLGMSASVAAGFLALVWIGSTVGRVLWGLVSDLLGGRRVVVLIFLDILSVLCMAFLTWLPSNASSLLVGVTAFVVGAIALGWPGLYITLAAELAGPELAGTGIGFLHIISRVNLFIPPLFGFVVDKTDSYDTGWWMMAGVAGVALLLLLSMRAESRRR